MVGGGGREDWMVEGGWGGVCLGGGGEGVDQLTSH